MIDKFILKCFETLDKLSSLIDNLFNKKKKK